VAEEDSTKPKRRLIKPVETVREKAVKASTADENKPRRLQKTTRKAAVPFRAVGRGAKKVGGLKPFRILGLILVPPYFRNSWKELKQVTWPGFRVSLRLTTAVIIFAVVFGVFIAALDFGLEKLFKEVLLK
jgi:preprotein translocase SecE subunit